MSLNPDIRDQAYQFFIEEAQELLQVLETGLLDLRQDHSTSKVHELMRAAHSIKGGAASVELKAIELLAHRLEDFFKALYSDSVEFDAELEGLLLQGYDCLSNPLTAQIEAGTFDEESALLTAEPVFAALEERLAEALENADNYIPSANDLGVDIVASIFEVDVAQALEHLTQVSANPTAYDPAAELEGQLEVFAGFAELFNLPGFSEIIQTARTALNQNPQHAIAIIKATIADCSAAQEQILAGDRQQGGTVSATLKALAEGTASEIVSGEPVADLTVDDGSIWGTALDSELTDDVFGMIPDASAADEVSEVSSSEPALEERSADDSLWSDFSDSELAEDVFGTIPAPSAPDETKEIADAVSDLATDDGSIWAIAPDSELAEDIFGAILNEASVSEADADNLAQFESSAEANATDSNDVNDIFGAIPDEQTDELPSIFAEVPDENSDPDLGEIFGSIPAPETTEVEAKATPLVEEPSPPEDITAAIASIDDIFDRLPSAADEPAFLPPVSDRQSSPKTEAQPAPQVKATPKLSVRVDLDRLERMNNLVGELTINRNSLALQNERLQESVAELGQKFSRFRKVIATLREMSDRMLLERHAAPNSTPSEPSNSALATNTETEFDALEMDSYSMLYAVLQEILEESVQLEESVDDITIFAKQSNGTIDTQRQMLAQVRDELMWVRMLPLDQILQRFPRTLRDLSRKYQKPVDFQLTGTGVLVDKAVLEKLSDPLLHLLRNGFDHGIEDPATRQQQGKPATGSIAIRAYYQGNQTVIEVKDDGKGLDLDKITQKGIERGLISASEAANATPERLFELIFEPGFSTASKVSEISGRGVGMNIVRSQIEALKGKISVTSVPDRGSTFTLRLPLTLTIAKLLVCSLGSTAFAIPSDSIEEIIIPTASQIKSTNEQKFLALGRQLIPIYSLAEHLQYNCPIIESESNSKAFKTIAPPEDWSAPLLLLRRGSQLFALEVVSLLSEQELVIKPYGKAIAAPAYSYGCTILSDGSLIPAFDGTALIGSIVGERVEPVISTTDIPVETVAGIADIQGDKVDTPTSDRLNSLKTIMVVDDSTALRRTMALTLEKAGYRVVQKKDGKEALNGFKQNPDLDLIICDVEMPVMNGFEFLGMRRRDSALSQVPTFMLTSRSGAKHRNLAIQLGADGYFTKPYVEQEFVSEVDKILTDKARSDSVTSAIAIKTKTILIIDDSSALRRTLALSLENLSYRVLQGRDGVEGLQLLRDNPKIDLVICDVEMPNMNGFEFLTARRDEQLNQVPVVMLTSRGSQKHRALASSLGAVGFFTKPYVEDQFIQEIEQYLRS